MLHVPSMEGLGRRAMMTMSMPLFGVDDEHNATGSLEETHSIASHGDAFVVQNARAHPKLTDHQLTDRPAQHGGAKRPPRTEIVGLSVACASLGETRPRPTECSDGCPLLLRWREISFASGALR